MWRVSQALNNVSSAYLEFIEGDRAFLEIRGLGVEAPNQFFVELLELGHDYRKRVDGRWCSSWHNRGRVYV